jgi:hypothetical protein
LALEAETKTAMIKLNPTELEPIRCPVAQQLYQQDFSTERNSMGI